MPEMVMTRVVASGDELKGRVVALPQAKGFTLRDYRRARHSERKRTTIVLARMS